jgi:hypothetical protein
MESAKSTSRWLNPIHLRLKWSEDHRNHSQHPFGNQAAVRVFHARHEVRPALGFAPQPCDWFAFSRMMTPQALVLRN